MSVALNSLFFDIPNGSANDQGKGPAKYLNTFSDEIWLAAEIFVRRKFIPPKFIPIRYFHIYLEYQGVYGNVTRVIDGHSVKGPDVLNFNPYFLKFSTDPYFNVSNTCFSCFSWS